MLLLLVPLAPPPELDPVPAPDPVPVPNPDTDPLPDPVPVPDPAALAVSDPPPLQVSLQSPLLQEVLMEEQDPEHCSTPPHETLHTPLLQIVDNPNSILPTSLKLDKYQT